MDPLSTSVATMSSSTPLSIFTSNRNTLLRKSSILPITKINSGNESDADLNPDSDCTNLVPLLNNRISFSPFSKDAAMGLILSAATGRGWTTGSGMEGPSVPAGANLDYGSGRVSTFPWSLFTRSPRRRMRVSFTCNICGQRTTRAINPHAYTDGTVFVQCCGCNVFHKLVDNLNLFHEMKCYVNPKFNYRDPKGDLPFNYTDMDDDFSIF